MFSFLKRKTDFYHVQRPGDRIGFPEGPRPQIRLAGFLTMRSSVTESSFESGCVEQVERCVWFWAHTAGSLTIPHAPPPDQKVFPHPALCAFSRRIKKRGDGRAGIGRDWPAISAPE